MLKHGYIVSLFIILLAACSGSEQDFPSQPDGHPLVFNASGSESATRAGSDLNLMYETFVVRTTKAMPATSQELVMPNYVVQYASNTGWQYDGIGTQFLKYWDYAATTYNFHAVTPQPNNDPGAPYAYKETTVNINDDNITLTNVKGNLSCAIDMPNPAPDWMVAHTVRTQTPLKDRDAIVDEDFEKQPSVFHSEVPLMFHRTMARVDFVAWAEKPLTLVKFSVYAHDAATDFIYNQGDYSTTDGWTNLAAVDYEEKASVRFCDINYTALLGSGRAIGTDREHPITLASNVEIPQLFAGGQKVLDIVCTASDGQTYTGYILLDEVTNESASWLQNKHYIYKLMIPGDGTGAVILFGVNINKWLWKDGGSVTSTQTNW